MSFTKPAAVAGAASLMLLGFYLHRHQLLSLLPSLRTGTCTSNMDSPIDAKASSERTWQMSHLRTKEECRLSNETIEVYTVELPSKHAESILKVIKENIEGEDDLDLQHLRRFAKPRYLPPHVLGQRDLAKEMYSVSRAWDEPARTVIQPDTSGVWQWNGPINTARQGRPSTLYLLVCPTTLITVIELHELLSQHTPFASKADSWAYPLEIKSVTVPRLAPTSPAQAAKWSDEYWPTFYRKTNPFGAHPSAISKAEEELHTPAEDNISIHEAMELAERVGTENSEQGLGIATGCVIIERVDDKTEVVSVAGDARYKALPAGDGEMPSTGCQGNIMSHAVMRALGFVARKRLRVASQIVKKSAANAESNFDRGGLVHDEAARDAFFNDLPLTELEEEYFVKDNIKPDGYLCLKLEIVTTHEPCIMCSMALVHSRVGRAIFKHRMPQTGGLTSELVSNDTGPVGLGYGLCWRKELNWQFMCWEYVHAEKQTHGEGDCSELSQEASTNSIISTSVEGYQTANDHVSSSFSSVRAHV